MKTIERNPDIMVGQEPMPEGMQVIEGMHLMSIPRRLGIPFGVAKHIVMQPCGQPRVATLGLIIRDEHVEAILEGIDITASKRKYYKKNKKTNEQTN
jgi:hypothetical protein